MCIYAGHSAMQARTVFPLEDCEVVVERDEKNPSYSLLFSSKAAINLWGAAHAGIRCACIARICGRHGAPWLGMTPTPIPSKGIFTLLYS